VNRPDPIDAEIAAVTFDAHLTQFFATGRGAEVGWERIDQDALHCVVRVPATRADETKDHYFVLLGAEFYDVWPTTVSFVQPIADDRWAPAAENTRWWPKQNNSPGFAFGLHINYPSVGGQLVCFSHTMEYYLTDHVPLPSERWRQGTHTVSATLTRIARVLTAPNYEGPSGDLNP
jgi:hypothetical protein